MPLLPLILLPTLLGLLAACERAPPPPAASSSAETRLRRGLVSIGDEQMPAYALDWQVPAVAIDANAIPAALRRAEAARKAGHLYADGDAAIPIYLAILAVQPDHAAAQTGLEAARLALYAQGGAALDGSGANGVDLKRGHAIAAVARRIAPEAPETLAYLAQVDAADRLQALLEHGENELAAGRLGENGIGAATAFREVLRNRPGDARALRGLAAVEGRMIDRARAEAAGDDYARAEDWLQAAAQLRADELQAGKSQAGKSHPAPLHAEPSQAVAQARRLVALRREARVAQLYATLLRRLASSENAASLDDAADDIALLQRVAVAADPRIAASRAALERANRYGRHRPRERFADALAGGGRGPALVVLPHGEFLMGAPENEPDSSKAEWPQHRVQFARGFAMARNETTVGEYARFIQATGYRSRAERRGYSVVYDERSGNFVLRNDINWRHDYAGRPAAAGLPVLHVDARDAEAYAEWLSAETGARYRLPHEAEFEYALRAGAQGRYPWGDGSPPRGAGNLTGSLDRSPSGRRWGNAFAGYGDGFWGPAPVGRDHANAFGLHDMAGNVGEWTMDCWHQGYRRAPADGGAWFNPGCRSRVVRGGTWSSAPAQARSAWRMSQAHDVTNARTGFRMVREI